MPVCAFKLCRNYAGKRNNDTQITFHRFPTDPVVANRWKNVIVAARKDQYWKPHRTSVVCSDHFKPEEIYITQKGLRRLKNGAVPSEYSYLSSTPAHSAKDIIVKQKLFASQMHVDADTQSVPAYSTVELEPQKVIEPETILEEFSDMESLFDTPQAAKLRKKLNQKIRTEKKHKTLIRSLRKKNFCLKRQNLTLKYIVDTIKKQRYIDEEVKNILEVNLFAANACYQKNKKIKGQDARNAKYSPEFRKFCLTLHFFSPRAYIFVRRKFERCLPHPKTITKWYCNTEGSPGFTEDAFEILRSKRMQCEQNLICALIVDEMAIRQQRCWNNKTLKDEGLVDFGNGPDENVNTKASEAFVLLLVSLNETWKLPVAYFFVHGLSGIQKANIIKRILDKCNDTGVDVVSLTFDGHPSNLAAMEILGCKVKCDPTRMKTTFKHPYADYEVAVFLDPCHMIKSIRNHFESKQCFSIEDNKEIKWEYVNKLYDLQCGTILHANNLKEKHVLFRNTIINAKLATQGLTSNVSKAIEFCRVHLKIPGYEDSLHTEHFIMLINNIFNIFNSRNLDQHGFNHSLLAFNKEEVYHFLEEARQFILKLRFKMSRKRSHVELEQQKGNILEKYSKILNPHKFTGFLGILICIESLKKLYDSLICTKKLKYLATYRLSQDHIELLFGAIRMHGDCNNKPNARQFMDIYRKLLYHMEHKAGDTSNSVPLECYSILTCSSAIKCINETTAHMRGDDEDESELVVSDLSLDVNLTQADIYLLLNKNPEYADYFEQIIGYIAGFIVGHISKVIKCMSCIKILTSKQILNFHKLVIARDKGVLIYVSKEAFKICRAVEHFIRDFIKQGHTVTTSCHYKKIFLKILNQFVGNIYFKYYGNCRERHQNSLLTLIIEKYLQVRCHYILNISQ